VGSRSFPRWQTVFNELPGFLRKSRWVLEILVLLRENDFIDVHFESLTLGTSAIVTATKR
jgi:hypothetical protein